MRGMRARWSPSAGALPRSRGSVNQALRLTERLEQELLAERTSRIDDLGILVDLISSGWNGVDARLGRLERGLEHPPAPYTARDAEATTPASREHDGADGRPPGDRHEQWHVLDEERFGLLAEAAPVQQSR